MRKSLNSLVLLSLGLAVVPTARAQRIADEGFDYGAGTAVIASEGTGGTGWAYAWNSKSDTTQTQVSSTGLSYTDGSGSAIIGSGGSLISSTTTSTTAQPERALAYTFGTLAAANTAASGTLWVSYLWEGLNTASTSSGLYRQSIMMFINGATSGTGSGSERLDVGMPNISSANASTVNPNISLWTSGGISGGNTYTSTSPLQSSVAANTLSATFVLMKFTVDNSTTTADTVQIWLNPLLTGAAPTAGADLTYSSQDLSAINGIRLQSGGYNATYGTVGGAQQVDEITFGNTVADVEAVPEPGALSLVTVGGLLALARRRK